MSLQMELLELLATNHPELERSGFAHVANLGQLQVATPYKLADGLQIRKASPNEVNTVQTLLLLTRPDMPFIPTRNPYETSVHSNETKPGTVSFSTRQLPEEEWRYHVISFEGSNAKLLDFVQTTVLTSWRLELGFTVWASGLGRGFGGGLALNRLWGELQRSDEPFVSLGLTELEDLRLVNEKVRVLENDRVNLRSAMKRIEQLDAIPKGSPLRFLGYVSVLESLITHAPDPKDPYDSLTRQVRQKMLLVGRRSRIAIPYNVFGVGVNPDKLWTRLYEYRSAVAHGVSADFAGKLKCLKNPATALEFISCATVAVMRQALEEPDLIADLQAC